MKRAFLILILLVSAIIVWLLVRPSTPPQAMARGQAASGNASNVSVTLIAAPALSTSSSHRTTLLGETILRDYANTNLPPEDDLTLMAHLMDNSLLLLKSAANRPLSANEDWAGLWRGRNTAHERFLPDQHVAFDAQGRLVDRWGTPLFFHALGGGRFELRSAGPDRKLWTADDIHRNADGSFRRGAALNPPSLLDAVARPPVR